MMKHIEKSLIALMTLLLIIACGGGSDGDDNNNGGGEDTPASQTFRQSVTLPATGAEQVVELNGLTAEISSITGAATWLTVLKNGEATKSVKLVAENNGSHEGRSCAVSISDKAANTVMLTVTQSGTGDPVEVDVDESHDLPTDQPAYSRKTTWYD